MDILYLSNKQRLFFITKSKQIMPMKKTISPKAD